MCRLTILATVPFLFSVGSVTGDENPSPIFYASFDASANAESARGDAAIYTAESLKRQNIEKGARSEAVSWSPTGGQKGGALRFAKKTNELTFFRGGKNVPFRKSAFEGTVSLWMKLDPKQDLPKGYVDPLQITDKKWNDASFFIDFDQHEQRDFRLGAFSNFSFWNPSNREFDDIPVSDRPMVVVKNPPFSKDKWTHVAFVWKDLNTDDGDKSSATLYLDGKRQGSVRGPLKFTWEPNNVVIMLGINYVGMIDELSIYDQALSEKQIKLLGK